MKRKFVQLDVFTDTPYAGNPLAVVIDGEGLSTEEMQRFARWTNLSETTFLLPPTDPTADYKVRIFTTSGELPFAGHPTLGSASAWLSSGSAPKNQNEIIQECGVGLVTIRQDKETLAFAAPPLIRSGPLDQQTLTEAIQALHLSADDVIDSSWIDNGPGWLGLLLRSAETVLQIRNVHSTLKIGIAGPHTDKSDSAYEVRAFFPSDGATFEDPVTGSLNASLAQWLVSTGRFTPPYKTSQGTAIGRDGRVFISADASGAIWVGGNVVECINGSVEL